MKALQERRNRAELIETASAIVDGAINASRALTRDEENEIDRLLAEADQRMESIRQVEADD